DGHLDLVTKHLTNRTVTVLLGNGQGTFTPAPECSLKLDFDPGWIAVGEVGQPKTSVLAVANVEHSNEIVRVFPADRQGRFSRSPPDHRPGRLSLRRGDGKGSFANATGPALSVPPDPTIATVVDVDNDGRPDIVLCHARSNILSILMNDRRGSLLPGRTVSLD